MAWRRSRAQENFREDRGAGKRYERARLSAALGSLSRGARALPFTARNRPYRLAFPDVSTATTVYGPERQRSGPATTYSVATVEPTRTLLW
jgi:hypothetical protein